MSTNAYILIEAAVGKTGDVAQALRRIPGMQTVDMVTGPYDIIALLEAQDLNHVGETITSRVHGTRGVLRTVTCLSMSS